MIHFVAMFLTMDTGVSSLVLIVAMPASVVALEILYCEWSVEAGVRRLSWLTTFAQSQRLTLTGVVASCRSLTTRGLAFCSPELGKPLARHRSDMVGHPDCA
jgi:hypothetical protein